MTLRAKKNAFKRERKKSRRAQAQQLFLSIIVS